jgi:hypothetical protein
VTPPANPLADLVAIVQPAVPRENASFSLKRLGFAVRFGRGVKGPTRHSQVVVDVVMPAVGPYRIYLDCQAVKFRLADAVSGIELENAGKPAH